MGPPGLGHFSGGTEGTTGPRRAGGDQRGRAAGLRIEVYNFEVTSRGLKRVKVIRGF